MDSLARISAYPRLALGRYPTALEPLPRLSRAVGGPPLWIKRDDALGPALGGNKTRKLEFLFGEAQSRGAQAVATFGGLQSNFARQMSAVARACGLEAHCYYFAPRPTRLDGNLLLASLAGARLHFVPFGGGDGGLSLEQATRLVRWIVRLTQALWAKRTYFMPVGGHTPRAGLGYVLAALEIDQQLREHGIQRATLIVAAGTGGTLAGLLAGRHIFGLPHHIVGIDVGKLWRGFPASIAALATEITRLVDQPRVFCPADIPLIEATYVGAGYARPTPDGLRAIHQLARLEGILLDPVYTSKALAGLLDLTQRGALPGDQPIVFWHTGGLPALWAYPRELTSDPLRPQ